MVVSAAKIEANRRNARKSTGPRTEEGKKRSSMNALKHGCRAETLVLPEEDPQELEDRRAAWTASLGPRCELEQRSVDEAVVYSWRQDRARRAEAARADVRMADGGDTERSATLKDVADLGRRLFKDRLGPVAFYPLVPDDPAMICTRSASTSYPPRQDDEDPDLPAILVLSLRESLAGCEWMLREWARLQSILERRQPWISADKLKAVRLLGRQPFDAIDDGDVALVFLATHRLKPEQAEWAWEILSEMDSKNQERFRSNAADRELESLMPADAAEARNALGALIQRETERLQATAEVHRRRECVKAARAGDLLGFDETPAGERLRRFEITSGRGYNRAIDTFLKLRRAEAIGQLSMGTLSGAPLPDGDDMAAATAETNAPSEPALDSDVDLSWALEYPWNEPSGDRGENVTNEATLDGENVANDATDVGENVTNEATDESLVIGANPLSQSGCASGLIGWPNTNEPIAAPENSASGVDGGHEKTTNEATDGASSAVVETSLGSDSSADGAAEPAAPEAAADRESSVPAFEIDYELMRARLAAVERQRAERLRKLNEESREREQGARATRRSRRRIDPTPAIEPKGQRRRRRARGVGVERAPSSTGG